MCEVPSRLYSHNSEQGWCPDGPRLPAWPRGEGKGRGAEAGLAEARDEVWGADQHHLHWQPGKEVGQGQ